MHNLQKLSYWTESVYNQYVDASLDRYTESRKSYAAVFYKSDLGWSRQLRL